MNDRWRSISIILAVILALLGGITAAIVLSGGPRPAVLPSPTTAASASNQPSGGVSPGTSSEPSNGASPSASAPGSPSPAPSPTPQANLTTITFTSMRLNAQKGANAGAARTFTFQTLGSGSVVATIKSTIASGRTILCLKPTGASALCRTSTGATLTYSTTRAKTNWVVTAIGTGTDSPTLDISLTFGADHPSVTLTNGRFDGAAFPLDGATFRLTTRNAGTIGVVANWGGHAFDYALLIEPASTPPHGIAPSGNSTGVTASVPAVAHTAYNGTLVNQSDGFGLTALTMTVSWP